MISRFNLNRVQPPVRRVLAVDAGSRCLKLLLAQRSFDRLHILKEELIDLQEEGLVSAEELKAHLQATLQGSGRPPLALVLPQHLSISQVVDLPIAPESEVRKLIEEETVKLSGVSESRIVYDFVRTSTPVHPALSPQPVPPGPTAQEKAGRQQFWVTLSQEGEIRERIARLGLEQEDLCEITTTANALIAAYRASCPDPSRAVLVHLGAQTTVVVILLAGQGAFAASFQMGGDFFTRSLARIRRCSEESAEALKRAGDLFTGPEASADFAGVVQGWAAELKRQLNEWFGRHPDVGSDLSSFELVASGGAFEQPGLLAYLKSKAGLTLGPWTSGSQGTRAAPSKRFEVAFGAALQALGYSAHPVSLLPEDYRRAWRKRLNTQKLEFASFMLVLLCVLVLALGTWRQASLLSQKQALLNKVQDAQEKVEANDALSAELVAEYEGLRPLFAAQQNTLDTLTTLALLQQTRSNRSFWYVLLADQQSYFSPQAGLGATNRPGRASLPSTEPDRFGSLPASFHPPPWAVANPSPAKAGLIAELCMPEEGEAATRVLSQLVDELNQQRVFAKVDRLTEGLRRNLADPKVILPDHNYVLTLDFAQTDFQQPPHWKKPPSSGRGTPKRTTHPPATTPEGGEVQ